MQTVRRFVMGLAIVLGFAVLVASLACAEPVAPKVRCDTSYAGWGKDSVVAKQDSVYTIRIIACGPVTIKNRKSQ